MSIGRVCVVGLGYIGLPTAAMFAARRVQVVGLEVNPRVVETINRGEVHIVEPELDMLVHASVTEGFLRATTAAEPADAFLIAVPTPFKGDHEPDLSYIEAAAGAIAPVLAPGNVVILESTSPVGATEMLADWLAAARPDLRFPGSAADCDVHVAHCPERVLPGQVVRELVENDRVIGGLTPACTRRAAEVYRVFVQGQLLETDARTAEMVKLTENAFRDVNIAFANELSVICARLGIDAWELIGLANHHPRVNILQPGCGVGGHCIAVDPWFIVAKTPDLARLVRTAREVNDAKPLWVVERVKEAFQAIVAAGTAPDAVRTAVLGLAFKPNIDDLRESPALRIAQDLSLALPGELLYVEPHVEELPPVLERGRKAELDTALAEADLIVLLVAHDAFKDIDSDRTKARIISAVGRA